MSSRRKPAPRTTTQAPAVAAASPTAPRGRIDDGQVGGTHYAAMDVTPWQFLESALTDDEMRGYLKAEVIVYLARERRKGGREDIQKAAHTLAKLLEVTGKRPAPDRA